MPDRLTLYLTGPLRLAGPDGPVAGLSRRGQALLAYLACQPGMRAERGALADLLWSDRGETQARASLRQELSTLRRALPEGVMEADRQAVWLDPAAVTLSDTAEGEFLQGFDLASEGFEDWLRRERARRADRPEPAAPTPAALGAQRPCVAVLAFEDFSGAADMFADGVVEEITGALSRVGESDVIARQSAFALKGEVLDVPSAAARLGADYVVEGTVRRSGDRVRISVQLVRGADGHTLWTGRFDDRLDDLFDLQDRIAEQVGAAISPSLRNAEIRRAARAMPTERSVYDKVLTAYPHLWAHRQEANARAIEILGDAHGADPGYGLATGLLAWAHAAQCSYLWTTDPEADKEKTRALVDLVLRDRPDHAPTLVATASAHSLISTDMGLASDLVDRALWLDPGNAWGWTRAGWIANFQARPEDALSHFDRAERLSPLDPFRFNLSFGRAAALRRLRRFDEAIAQIEDGLNQNPGAVWALRMLVATHAIAGDLDAARAAAERWRAAYPTLTARYLRACLPPSWDVLEKGYVDAMVLAGIPEG